MRSNRGLLAIIALAVVDLALFMISGIPRYKNATHGVDTGVSNIVWFGFLIGALTLIVTLATVLVRRVVGARRAAAGR
ncbi:MAG: hypothetical protein ACXV3S_09875 [Kineosporiaceae bacterium]